jgi:hypothetical protein
MLDAILNHPAVKKARVAGEERFGKAVAHLLANERVMSRIQGRIQSLVATALQARETFESGVRLTLHAVNLPSTDEVEELKRKLGELEAIVDDLAARVGHGSGPSDGEKR